MIRAAGRELMTESQRSAENPAAECYTEQRRFSRYVVLALALITVALFALASISVYFAHESRLTIAALERQFEEFAHAGLQRQISENDSAILVANGSFVPAEA